MHDAADADAVVITAAIDNLVKGAAGQAIQNMNVARGLAETAGLAGARRLGVLAPTAALTSLTQEAS